MLGGHRAVVVGGPWMGGGDLGNLGDGYPSGGDAGFPHARFNGAGDGLQVNLNPIQGCDRFFIEIDFVPEPGGLREQRFFHIQEDGSDHRVLFETRLTADGFWYADTFVKSAGGEAYLNDPTLLHPTGRRHTMGLLCDGNRMVQYVDGIAELETPLKFQPLGPGSTSIGMRIDRVFWFKGAICSIRIHGG